MTSSPGAYKGVAITGGTDAEVAAQISAIDARPISTPIVPTTLNSTNTQSNPAITLPTPQTNPANYGGMIIGGNALLGANTTAITPSGATVDTKTGAVVTPPPTGAYDQFKSYISSLVKPPSASDQYNTDYNASGIDTKQTQFNTDNQALKDAQAKLTATNASLAGLNAEATAIPIQDQQDATGRGITAAGLAPKTADELRVNALKALPLQAQALAQQAEVAAAQGNATLSQSILQQAQDHLDKVFQIHQTDASNQYQYQNALIDKVYQFASAQEKQQLDDQKATLATNNSEYNNFVNDIRTAASSATTSGQSSVATKLASLVATLNPNSKTFSTDYQKAQQTFATLQGQINTSGSLDNQYKQLQIQKLQQDISSAKSTGAPTVGLINDKGQTVSIPTDVAPYYNVSSSGVGYIDASTLQGTAKEKTQIINQAQAAGLKVITNKNTAADLVNIKDAKAKLDTVSTVMAGIAQPNWVSRLAGGLGITWLQTATQSDPQKAASGALESIGLDILKAISGVQGFRGNQTAIQQVTEHLPKITDTVDTINSKVNFLNQLISDREDAAVGKPQASTPNTDYTAGGVTYSKGSDGLYYPKNK